jgi:hypothetical protein
LSSLGHVRFSGRTLLHGVSCEIILKNMVEPETMQIRWHLCVCVHTCVGAYCISKATCMQAHAHTHVSTPSWTHTCTCPHQCTHTHTRMCAHMHKYVICTAFHSNNDFVNTPQYHVTRTLPVLFSSVPVGEYWGNILKCATTSRLPHFSSSHLYYNLLNLTFGGITCLLFCRLWFQILVQDWLPWLKFLLD